MTFKIYGAENLAKAVYNLFDEDVDKASGLWFYAYRNIADNGSSELGIYQTLPENVRVLNFDYCARITRAPGSFMYKTFTEFFDVDLCDPELYTNRDGRVEEHILGEGECFLDNKNKLIKQLEIFLGWSLKGFA